MAKVKRVRIGENRIVPIKIWVLRTASHPNYHKAWKVLAHALDILSDCREDAALQQLCLDRRPGKRVPLWVLIDTCNGNQVFSWYVWIFKTKREALAHQKKQNRVKTNAHLSDPVPAYFQ